jgi:hypothetical protein
MIIAAGVTFIARIDAQGFLTDGRLVRGFSSPGSIVFVR